MTQTYETINSHKNDLIFFSVKLTNINATWGFQSSAIFCHWLPMKSIQTYQQINHQWSLSKNTCFLSIKTFTMKQKSVLMICSSDNQSKKVQFTVLNMSKRYWQRSTVCTSSGKPKTAQILKELKNEVKKHFSFS